MDLNNKERQQEALQWEVNNRTFGTLAINRGEIGKYRTGCQYAHQFNGGCAVGRLVPEELAAKLSGPVRRVFEELPESVSCMGLRFLASLQRLHDNPDNWDSLGLSKKGVEGVRTLAQTYGLTIDFSKYESSDQTSTSSSPSMGS